MADLAGILPPRPRPGSSTPPRGTLRLIGGNPAAWHLISTWWAVEPRLIPAIPPLVVDDSSNFSSLVIQSARLATVQIVAKSLSLSAIRPSRDTSRSDDRRKTVVNVRGNLPNPTQNRDYQNDPSPSFDRITPWKRSKTSAVPPLSVSWSCKLHMHSLAPYHSTLVV